MAAAKKFDGVADILEREIESTIKEWLRRVNAVVELVSLPISDVDRTDHLPKLYHDLICRLRRVKNSESPIYPAAAAHGKVRFSQGYSATLLIEESRIFEVATFNTLHLHQDQLDHKQVLSDVMIIADEVDAQLTETVRGFMEVQRGRTVA